MSQDEQRPRAQPDLGRPRVRPALLVWVAVGWLAVMWAMFLLIDAWNVAGLRESFAAWAGGRIDPIVWLHVFNSRPTEWLSWGYLAAAAVAAAYLAGRLRGRVPREATIFWALIAVTAVLILIEEAGDVRHVLSLYVHDLVGPRVVGLPFRIIEVPYFAVIAAVPIFAAIRYGRWAWASRTARRYLVAFFALYAVIGAANGFRHLGGLYVRLGRYLHDLLSDGLMVIPIGLTQDRLYFFLMDAVVEETVELLAAASLLAAIVAYAHDAAAGRLEDVHDRQDEQASHAQLP